MKHNVKDNSSKILKQNFVNLGEGSEDNRVDNARRIKFDIIEEDRVNENNEDFVVVEPNNQIDICRVNINGRRFRNDLKSNNLPRAATGLKILKNTKSPPFI